MAALDMQQVLDCLCDAGSGTSCVAAGGHQELLPLPCESLQKTATCWGEWCSLL